MSTLQFHHLESLRLQFELEAFVETGCYQGDGIAAVLAAGFWAVRSCDIDARMVEHCRNRFAGDARVRIEIGDSVSALGRILGEDLGPALFWLDGHYPAFYGLGELETAVTRFPVPQELELIHLFRKGAVSDVILVDDIRVVNAPDNPRWRPGEVADYYRVDLTSLAELCQKFEDTHELEVDGQQEGLLVLSPKLVEMTCCKPRT